MTKLLAFDISSAKTGVAFFENNILDKKSLSTIEPNSKECLGARLKFFSTKIKKLIKKYKPDVVVIEDIFKGFNIGTFKTLAMFRGVAILTIFELTGFMPISLMAVEARNFAKVDKSKELAFDAINKLYSLKFNFEKHNDMADAIVLGLAVINGATTSDKKSKKKKKVKK